MIQIIPAIDIMNGKCVRLIKGDFLSRREYGSDPVEMARRFENHGLERLHLVDLDGAKAGKVINYRTLELIASKTSLIIDFSGGIRDKSDIKALFNSGAHMITVGSVAVRERDTFAAWLRMFGSEKIILGSDFKEGKITISGWEEDTEIELMDFLKEYFVKGIHTAICTDVNRDGMLQGPSFEVYSSIKKALPALQLIASGGISGICDIEVLNSEGIDGAIIGKALYEGKINLKDIEKFVIGN
ncbi:MAG: 1-(5-phosphoribosyl)-5-[(5-phosphoribosylamino)methylideneamino]imidazole-4-carboxamide isomerase [Bacteroidales bacterium]|nr:1-(5-phosphoribosyl)-5-[(5-phosphoribosylamino)methylideneamino]imidazole-4-carboxamide isomerase [Bacteroidales bacterium]